MQSSLGNDVPEPVISGAKYRASHKHSVIAILADKAPPVSSRGSRFYHVNRWTTRIFVVKMTDWAKENQGCVPTTAVIASWVSEANAAREDHPEIVIANTPDELPQRVALALTGGAYHEAWHGKYSVLRDLTVEEMAAIVLPRWAKVKDWSKLASALLEWSNLIEDVRIERRGCEEFEHTPRKMQELQDFILRQEFASDYANYILTQKKPSEMSLIARTFRDIGLGYDTQHQQDALQRYRDWDLRVEELVARGPLAPMLEESIHLTVEDGVGSLRVTLDVLAKLAELGKEDEAEQQAKQGQCGDGEQKCPKCGAPGDKLIVRPKSDGKGGKVKGKGICTCTVCGFQQEVDIVPKRSTEGKSPNPSKGPKFEGFDLEDLLGSESGGSASGKIHPDKPKPGKGSAPAPGAKNPEPGGGQKGGKGQGTSPESKPSNEPGGRGHDAPTDGGSGDKGKGPGEGPDGKDKDGTGPGGDKPDANPGDNGKGDEKKDGTEKKDGDKGDGKKEGDGNEPEDSKTDGTKGQRDDEQELDPKAPANPLGAGGHYHDESTVDNDWSELIDEALKQGNTPIDKLDNNTALEDAVKAAQEKVDGDVKLGEEIWNPYDPSLDQAAFVKESKGSRARDAADADKIIASVKAETSFLRSRMRTTMRSMEQVRRVHGVPKGRRLSARYLVDSKTMIMSGKMPRRAYVKRGAAIDMTMSAVIVLDQSSSMTSKRKTATRILVALTEPLDGLGCPTLAIGFRDGKHGFPVSGDNGTYHRHSGIIYDVFKLWNEKFRGARWRFANTCAVGGTPMADGIQYGLKAISPRNEAHRIIFVVTDGMPNNDAIVRRQIRLAKEAGIHMIGVGIGAGSESVMTLFPDHVFTNRFEEFPKLLMAKLNELVDINAGKRGVRVKDD